MTNRDSGLPDKATPGRDATTDREPASMLPRSIRPRRRSSRPLFAALLLVLAVLLPHSAQAVRITFDNCLSTNYKEHKPPRLQWEPLYVDAVFDTEEESHNLRVTAWGNVTGPPAKDKTLPQIDRQPDPKGKATTLIKKVNVLTYEPYRKPFDFCTEGLENGSCPLLPVLDPTA